MMGVAVPPSTQREALRWEGKQRILNVLTYDCGEVPRRHKEARQQASTRRDGRVEGVKRKRTIDQREDRSGGRGDGRREGGRRERRERRPRERRGE
eukprot:scaffold29927_cov23-Tisochrysis_lutea.AAC.3